MERQMGPIESIRPDHVARYRLASLELSGNDVVDLACGCGYGSQILQEAGFSVTGIDADNNTIVYARKNYPGSVYVQARAEKVGAEMLGVPWEVLVSFETLEHLADPEGLIARLEAPEIIASVPNEECYPFKKETFANDRYPHLRHYTPDEFRGLLKDYRIINEWCQRDKAGAIYPGLDGMFMILHGRR
jgi:SAM-dependent methyltransferase